MSEANAVVVLFAGALGDFLLALPALRLLRRRHGGARCTMAVRSALAWVAEQAACADRVAALDDRAVAHFLGGGSAPAWWPPAPHLHSWFGGDQPSVRDRLQAAARRAEFHHVVRGEGASHAAIEYARAAGCAAEWDELVALARLRVPPARRPGPDALLVLHRGAGARAKRWHEEGYARVAAWWRATRGPVVELLGPAEEAESPLPGVEPMREQPLPAVAGVLARAHAYVGNDTGPSHLAGALGVPGVALFGPTDPCRWRPLSERLFVLRADPVFRGADGFHDPPATVVIDRLSAALP